jgi:aromatic-L-amino-acid decarboxylase
VDAAYGGFWRLVPELRERVPDLAVADSVVANPHKVLYAPLEVTALYCRRAGALPNTFRLVPEYLRVDAGEGAVDYMNYSPQLGRAFRALKLWWIIRSYGLRGLAARLARACELADWLRAAADEDPDWQRPADSPYPLVCLRYQPVVDRMDRASANALNAEIVARVNASGRAFVSHAVLREGYVIRVSVGNIRTTQEDVARLWDLLRQTARTCRAARVEVSEEAAT